MRADELAGAMPLEQLLELGPATAALRTGATAIGQLFDRGRAALDLTVNGVVGDRPAVAHVHVPRLGQPDLTVKASGREPYVVVVVPGVSVMVIVLIVTFLVGAPSPLVG